MKKICFINIVAILFLAIFLFGCANSKSNFVYEFPDYNLDSNISEDISVNEQEPEMFDNNLDENLNDDFFINSLMAERIAEGRVYFFNGNIQHLDYNGGRIKLEATYDCFKINDELVDMGHFGHIYSVQIIDDVIIVETMGSDRFSKVIFACDMDVKCLFEIYYLDIASSMVFHDFYIEGNKIFLEADRTDHYYGSPTVLVNGSETDLDSAEAKLLDDNMVVKALYEIIYLGDGKFTEIKKVKDIMTLGDYKRFVDEQGY